MSYRNPVYPGSCPDPFVLKYCGEYWCYSTGWAPDGKAIHVLHSRDLVEWRSVGGAMEALPGGAPEYWAPEVTYVNGRFYLYYSLGDGVEMRLRVAVASAPDGPFHDSGRLLTNEIFAIDAHVFEDEDGSRFLFYAKDFLDHTHIGTGTVVARMIDPLTLEGKPRPVALPHYDWQVFNPHRVEKGGVRWHTVEGPFVLKYKGRYYQMFSGGNWRNLTYGVSYALADSIDSQQEWTQVEHDDHAPLVLSTIPGQVIGPGHNSVVRGPDNRQLFCIYHRWAPDESARLLSIDRLEWIGERLSVLGPSTAWQENPHPPQYPVFDEVSGHRDEKENAVIQRPFEDSSLSETGLSSDCFVVEVSVAAMPPISEPGPQSKYGVRLLAGESVVFEAGLNPARAAATIDLGGQGAECVLPLGPDFSSSNYHLLRIECNALQLELQLDGRSRWRGLLRRPPEKLALFSEKILCSFRACAITYGFEDTFYGPFADPEMLGWRVPAGKAGKWGISSGEMLQIDSDALNCVLVKEHPFKQYELVINARVVNGGDPESCYGFFPAFTETGEGPLMRIEERENKPCLAWYSQQENGAWQLPDGFGRHRAQQFRIRKCRGRLNVFREADMLGSLAAPDGPTCAALYANRAQVSFDLVRLTSLDHAGIEDGRI